MAQVYYFKKLFFRENKSGVNISTKLHGYKNIKSTQTFYFEFLHKYLFIWTILKKHLYIPGANVKGCRFNFYSILYYYCIEILIGIS